MPEKSRTPKPGPKKERSYFSRMLWKYENKYLNTLSAPKMAGITGYNTSTISGWLNGSSKTKVPYPFVLSCASALGLSPEETAELVTAYEKDKYGTKKVRKKKCVNQFLSSLHEGILLAEESSQGAPVFAAFSGSDPITILNTPAQLSAALEILCREEDSQEGIDLFLPGSFPELGRILCENADRKVTQIFSLVSSHADPEGGAVILSYLRSLIPALYSCGLYRTFYYYNEGKDPSIPFPWFACTSKSVLIVSGGCRNGMLLQSRKAARLYRQSFADLLERSNPFVESAAPDAATLPYYEQLVVDLHTPAYSLELSSCLSLFISGYVLDSLQKELSDRIPPELADMLGPFLDYIGRLQKGYQDFKVVTYFSEGGIREFIETGWIYALPEAMLPIPPHLRLVILQKMLEDFDKYELYMIRKEFPEENMKFRLYVCGDRGYIQLNSKDNAVLTLDIRNNTLLGLLSNYFETLNEDFAWSKEESKGRLALLVEECDRSLPRAKASEKKK